MRSAKVHDTEKKQPAFVSLLTERAIGASKQQVPAFEWLRSLDRDSDGVLTKDDILRGLHTLRIHYTATLFSYMWSQITNRADGSYASQIVRRADSSCSDGTVEVSQLFQTIASGQWYLGPP